MATWGVLLDTGCSVWLPLSRISAARSATITTAAPVWPPAHSHAGIRKDMRCLVHVHGSLTCHLAMSNHEGSNGHYPHAAKLRQRGDP